MMSTGSWQNQMHIVGLYPKPSVSFSRVDGIVGLVSWRDSSGIFHNSLSVRERRVVEWYPAEPVLPLWIESFHLLVAVLSLRCDVPGTQRQAA